MNYYVYPDELYHHGIKGMKWGVRRTHKQPGHRTSNAEQSDKEKRKNARKAKSDDRRNRGILTEAQLKKKIERLKLEKKLKDLTDEQIYPGRTAAEHVLSKVGTTALTGAALYGIKAVITRRFDVNEFGNAVFNGGPKKK